MAIVKVGWSGGKDSTCSVLLHLEQGDTVKAVCYIPMFTKEIPLITKKHYEFIMNTADRLRGIGAEVYIVSGMTYWEYCFDISRNGKNKGQVKGYPFVNCCGFRRDSKISAVTNCNVGKFDYLDIAIAYDEIQRHTQFDEKKRSILIEKQISELEATRICIGKNMYSPHYEISGRDGCVLCFNAKPIERKIWFSDYPQAIKKVKELQDKLKPLLVGRPNEFPLRNYRYFIDTDQIDMFGNYLIN